MDPPGGFNEAAARCRGKPLNGLWDLAHDRGFNEAAARCRGKRRRSLSGREPSRCFNEAAARCRGKPVQRQEQPGAKHDASMRPRPDAAENSITGAATMPLTDASMRPRPDAAEN